jgi:energy-coupling factor transporter ATP-binding protein EcfA2
VPHKKITEAHFRNFTAFRNLELSFSPGINVLIGENGTGKTHILKALYAACDVTKSREDLGQKLIDVFMPFGKRPGRLVHREAGRHSASISISTGDVVIKQLRIKRSVTISFSTLAKSATAMTVKGKSYWYLRSVKCVYIPVKEMLANAPHFLASLNARELHFEAVYGDIIQRAYLAPLRGPTDTWRKSLLKTVGESISGRVVLEGEEFFLRNRQGNLEFSLLAEGHRKLALLLLLIQNGTLSKDSILFWDEPEASLNPAMMRSVVTMLFELQRHGVQVFLATHDYVLLKEMDLQKSQSDSLVYHALYRTEVQGDIAVNSTSDYLSIHPSAISDTFAGLYDRSLDRMAGGL